MSFTLLDQERLLLEHLEALENAITDRLKRNSNLYTPKMVKNHNVLPSKKLTQDVKPEYYIQQHEIHLLKEEYKRLRTKLFKLLQGDDVDDMTAELKDDTAFTVFNRLFNDIAQTTESTSIEVPISSEYQMWTSQTSKKLKCKKKRRIQSKFADNLRLSDIFFKSEQYDKFLDLRGYYRDWLNLKRNPPLDQDQLPSYESYLSKLITPEHSSNLVQDDTYFSYLSKLSQYIINYHIKTNIIFNSQLSIDRIKSDISKNKLCRTEDSGKVYCLICEKEFAKYSVYNAHLLGKKHVKSGQRDNKLTVLTTTLLIQEILTTLLSKQYTKTLEEVQRFKQLSVREQQLEQQDNQKYSLSDDELIELPSNKDFGDEESNEKENSEETGETKTLSLGANGKPIPHWLHKQQGLNRIFSCEICGNMNYNGSGVYRKHFSNTTHKQGLNMLGVLNNGKIDAYVYNGLSTVSEVLSLHKIEERKLREELSKEDGNVEVEDDNGNKMSLKVYEQLKKQGLM